MKPLIAFVACAFGREDVDEIYDRCIRQVLKDKGISARRVDRIEHNEDVDDKILELINSCDLCIADLTYARPSVYFEAGYVSGLGKPVIYTARSDHFKDRPEDDFGTQRVHFDLKMKNIIPWASPTKTFRKRLGSRLNVVTKPLLRDRAAQEAVRKEKEEFGLLPQQEQCRLVLDAVVKRLKKLGMRPASGFRWRDQEQVAWSVRGPSDARILLFVVAAPSFTKRRLSRLGLGTRYVWIEGLIKRQGIDPYSVNTTHLLCCSLRSVPHRRVADALPSFDIQKQPRAYTHSPAGGPGKFVHVVDSITRISEFSERVESHLKDMTDG